MLNANIYAKLMACINNRIVEVNAKATVNIIIVCVFFVEMIFMLQWRGGKIYSHTTGGIDVNIQCN